MGKAKGNTQKARQLNETLENIRASLKNHYRDIEVHESFVTVEKIRNAFLGITAKQRTLLELFKKHAAAMNFLNALEKIPSTIDQYKAKNEMLEKEIPQLQEIVGKVWKKEYELKQLKSELAALDRKIQLELSPPTPDVAEKNGQEVKPDAGGVRNVLEQHIEDVPQIRSPVDERSPFGNFIADHIIIGRPGFQLKDENRLKGIKI